MSGLLKSGIKMIYKSNSAETVTSLSAGNDIVIMAVYAIRQASLPGGEPELVDVLDPNESFMFVMDSFLDYIAFMMNRRVQNCSFRFICESQH